ncbi:MAG: cystathionine gamma-synthase family protein [Flavobacteriaceae bacterium]|nr:cystathionine gamma-synthase family protein [Flavobacteriaceae bacterium]
MHKESQMMSFGYTPEWSEGSVKPPIFQTSTFVFKTAEEGKRFFEVAYGKSELNAKEEIGLIYSRINNPNMQILEERLAVLEGSESAAAFESGMSAISTTMLSYLKPGDILIYGNPVYGGTHHFITHFLKDIGVKILPFSSETKTQEIITKLDTSEYSGNVKMIYFESPANPTNSLFDLDELKKLKDEISVKSSNEIMLVMDNTYLGPLWQKPLDFGVDIVCYSATKFLNGHSDVIAGCAMGSKKVIQPIKTLRTFLGSMIAPYTAWLLTRSLETLHLRMAKQGKNAEKVVNYLMSHKSVKTVSFPGIETMGEKQNEIFKRQCLGSGAMISFEVFGGEKEAFKFLNNLKLIKLAVSLGSNESLAQHPYSMTHADVPDDIKLKIGINQGLIRLSVGIENAEDIISDLNNAFKEI